MTQVNDMNTIQGWFKTSYADKIVDLIPDSMYYVKEVKEISAEMQQGGVYAQPVTLTSEQGITKASANSGAFSLNAPVALASRQAQIEGSQLLLRSALDYESVFRSKNKNSFIQATKGIVQNMIKSMYYYIESDMMWGKTGIGTVAAGGVAGNTVTITTAEYAPGFWLGSEGRSLRFESAAGVLRGLANVVSYDIALRTVTVDALPAGVVATDVIFHGADGATGANSMVGLYNMIATSTGNLFGIPRTSYGLWSSAGAFAAGNAPLTFNKVMHAITQAANKGLGDDIREIDVIVSTKTWTDLGNDAAALRRLDAKYSKDNTMIGQEQIEYFCSAGSVSIHAHKLMKEGYAFIHPKASRCLEAIGSQPKPTFELPGMVSGGEKQYLKPMENNAGVETRLYANTSLFTTKIAQMDVVTGIVNSNI